MLELRAAVVTRAWAAGCTGLLMAGIAAGCALAVTPACGVPAGLSAFCLWGLAARWGWLDRRQGRGAEGGQGVRARVARHAVPRSVRRGRLSRAERDALDGKTDLDAAVWARATVPLEAL